MNWDFSTFGQQMCVGSGIGELMDDLGEAIAAGGDRIRMLGGGQPSHIPEMDEIWRRRIEELSADPSSLDHMLGNYEPPVGNQVFRRAIAELFNREFDWGLDEGNVAVTAGGQTALFMLFNSLSGRFDSGACKKVLLPLVPEYIGYANQSVGGDLFRAFKPRIELLGEHDFKYRVDFENLEIGDDVSAICVSRPTNPTANVLTDDEIQTLSELAGQNNIPLIIDNAYGAPFPNVIFTDASPIWNENIILTLSLSKIGLPGTRTGIVVAKHEIIDAVSSMTSIIGLANNNIGQALTTPLIQSGEILRLSNEVVQPFYRDKSIETRRIIADVMDDRLPYRVHRSEGAFFLWMWFEDMPITSRELYERLKARDVLVVPGNYFFFGTDDSEWRHRDECIRVSFTAPRETMEAGIQAIAEEVSRAYSLGR